MNTTKYIVRHIGSNNVCGTYKNGANAYHKCDSLNHQFSLPGIIEYRVEKAIA